MSAPAGARAPVPSRHPGQLPSPPPCRRPGPARAAAVVRAAGLAFLCVAGAFAAPAWSWSEQSRGALRAGDCGPALADPAGPTTDAERLALARCRLRTGAPAAAIAAMSGMNAEEWGPWIALTEAEALLSADKPGPAAERLRGLQLPGPAGELAQLLRGRALIEARDFEGGRQVLSALLSGALAERGAATRPGGADPAEVRWWLAQGALRRGDLAAAVPALERVWTFHPAHPRGAEAEAHLKQLGRDPNRASAPEDRARLQERVRTLDKLNLSAEALALRDRLGPMSPREEAKAAFAGRDYARAAKAYGKMGEKSDSDAFDEALATSRAGDYARAARLYTALYTAKPTGPKSDTASFKVGYLSYDAGELEAAIPALRAHLQRYPSSKHADEARWFIGWAYVRLDRSAEARAALDELTRLHPSSELSAGARYWKARLAERAGEADAARQGYQSVLKTTPTSGYALFAAQRLNQRYAGVRPSPPPTAPAALTALPRWRRGRAMAEVGLDAWAREELAGVAAAAKAAGPEARLAYAHALVLAGEFTGAKAALGRPCGSPGPSADPAIVGVCWPRPLGDEALRRARAGDLDPNLPFGIMMAESGMQPEVSSPAGARGLMQLMPALGQRLEGARGQPFDPDWLYQPGYNAALGIEELSNLQRSFGGRLVGSSLPAVIAGYNGGPEAVERWLGLYKTPPEADRFAEDISFTETRRYVKRVLGYLQTWRLVYGDAPAR